MQRAVDHFSQNFYAFFHNFHNFILIQFSPTFFPKLCRVFQGYFQVFFFQANTFSVILEDIEKISQKQKIGKIVKKNYGAPRKLRLRWLQFIHREGNFQSC